VGAYHHLAFERVVFRRPAAEATTEEVARIGAARALTI
jgi:hypothetical protein